MEIASGAVTGKIGVTPSFYLSEPIVTYRQAKEEDYGATKYVM